jgi:hypothetical protein
MNFNNLAQFYTSAEWRNCRDVIIASRTKDDGYIYDEFTGRPIVKNYDIVLHHKKPLTIQNVNDASISLNPENIMVVSQKSHNEIHARFGYTTQRKVYYVYGAPCSGKTTFVNDIKGNSDLVVDMDNIWQCVTGGKRYEKPNALKTNVFAIRDLLYDQIRTRAGKWERAFVIDGGALKGVRTRQIEVLQAEEIYIDTDKQTCLKRLYGDNTRTQEQKNEWTRYIEQWFNDFQV